jgi:glycosyltransferase involved in cell wall biosynthesis
MRSNNGSNAQSNFNVVKKRIAVVVYGGVGTGHFAQGYPMLEKLLTALSQSFELVIYSQFAPHPDFKSSFQIRYPAANIKSGWIRWIYLVRYLIHDHRKEKFNILFAFWGFPSGVLVAALGKFLKLPSAIYLLGSDSAGVRSINFGILHHPIKRRIVKWAYSSASLVLAISQYQVNCLAAYGIKIPISVIPWGADLLHYKFVRKERQTTLHVIHVGHLTAVKDQVTLLKTFALLIKQRKAELRIFGGDSLNGEIQKLSVDLGLENHVRFCGMIPYHQMPEQYAWADIMLHTSLSEGQSMALTEAAACGVLLAGTRVGLLYDLGDDYGVVVAPSDYKDLASKVLSIADVGEIWESKIRLARAWSEEHDLQWTVDELNKKLAAL